MPKQSSPLTAHTVEAKGGTKYTYINKTRTIAIDTRNEPTDYLRCKNERCKKQFIPEHSRQIFCKRKCANEWHTAERNKDKLR